MAKKSLEEILLVRIERLGEAFYDLVTPSALQVDSMETYRLNFQFGLTVFIMIAFVALVVYFVDRYVESRESATLRRVTLKLRRFDYGEETRSGESAYETIQNRRRRAENERRNQANSNAQQGAMARPSALAGVDEKHIPTFFRAS